MPWELGGAILGATEPVQVGVRGQKDRGWCSFFTSSRFQTAFLFAHTETIKHLSKVLDQIETRSITAAPFIAVLLECVLSAARASASCRHVSSR